MIEIFQYPHETLMQVSSDWNKNDSIEGYDDLEKFEHDYIKLMQENFGIGLAANQVGITKRFFAIGSESFDTFKKPVIIWNPRVTKTSEEKRQEWLTYRQALRDMTTTQSPQVDANGNLTNVTWPEVPE